MTRLLIALTLVFCLCLPVSATDFSAPSVPDSGQELMPESTDSFGQGVMELLRKACGLIRPDLAEAAGVSVSIIAAAVLISLLRSFSGVSKSMTTLAGAVVISLQLFSSANTMILLGSNTIQELSSYGKLLLPVMTAALAAQGGVTSSTALYVGTTIFDTLLSSLIARLLTPMIYLFLALGVAVSALGDETLKKMQDLVKGIVTWSLKTILIVFTAYMGITGVVSGTTDAMALKATKLTISTVVPVVGGILSDASEAVLVSVGTMKNAAGIYGILAAAAIFLEPFLKIGAHYLVLKVTGAVCTIFDPKGLGGLVDAFSSAMGLILAMTGASCLLLLVSTVCFLKGVS
ncbi:MAG: hypothetical protein ACI3WQ_08760 [Faecousia sp.]